MNIKEIIIKLNEKVMSQVEYAEHLGVSTKSIYRRMKAGKIKYYRFKNIVLIPINQDDGE